MDKHQVRRSSAGSVGGSSRRPDRIVVDVRAIQGLAAGEIRELERVADRFAFRANDYYLDLIEWDDPGDPIRRLVVPDPGELCEFGRLDASDEAAVTQMRGLQHKYPDTALLLVTDQCAGFCRYCFRKRLFRARGREVSKDISAGVDYIARRAEITDVLLTGGDPLTLPTPRLAETVASIARIPHVRTVRIGTKMVAFNPYRILDDAGFGDVFDAARGYARVYVMTHFDHPREFTSAAVAAVERLERLGATCLNQCPVTAGINDDAVVLAELFQRCTDAGCPQYYAFQGRPVAGNVTFKVPIVRAFALVAEARARVSGLSARARLCMSHASGKVEVVGVDRDTIYARYHRAKDARDTNRVLLLERDDAACWLDELVERGSPRRPAT